MAKTEFVRARVEPELKHQAEEVSQDWGYPRQRRSPYFTPKLLCMAVCPSR